MAALATRQFKCCLWCRPLLCRCRVSSLKRRCSALQHTATHCNTQEWYGGVLDIGLFVATVAKYPYLKDIAVHYCTLQNIMTHCNSRQYTATHCNTLQHSTTHCDTLQHTATHCDILHHAATHGITLQHTVTELFLVAAEHSPKKDFAEHCNTHCNTNCTTHCNTLPHSSVEPFVASTKFCHWKRFAVNCSIHTCCNILQDPARHCKTLRDRDCKTLQDTLRHCKSL